MKREEVMVGTPKCFRRMDTPKEASLLRRREHKREYVRNHRKMPEVKAREKGYDSMYKRIIRHLPGIIWGLCHESRSFTLGSLSKKICKSKGIRIKSSTMECLLKKIEMERYCPLLIKVGKTGYRVNEDYFKRTYRQMELEF